MAVSAGAGDQASKPDALRLVGMWRLAEVVDFNANAGERPTGLLVYDRTGHMAVQIQPDRKRPSWPQGSNPSDEQIRGAFDGYTAYFGTYSVDEKQKTVTHHREGALNLYQTILVRKYAFQEDGNLVLSPIDRPASMLIWAPVK
jgi:hypothetical protein